MHLNVEAATENLQRRTCSGKFGIKLVSIIKKF